MTDLQPIRDILADVPPLRAINPDAYEWKRIYGSEAIREWAKGKTVVEDVTIREYFRGAEQPHLPYAFSLETVHDGVLFDDGTALLVATHSEFFDTNHDPSVVTGYFTLTPRPKAEPIPKKKRSKRAT